MRGKVISQLNGYIKRISDNFEDYKKCYEINFKQKQKIGLLASDIKINIVRGVLGLVVVSGYSGIALKNIKELKKKDPSVKILNLKNMLDLSKII